MGTAGGIAGTRANGGGAELGGGETSAILGGEEGTMPSLG